MLTGIAHLSLRQEQHIDEDEYSALMEYYWQGRKKNYSEQNLSHCQLVHNEIQVDWTCIEAGTPRWNSGDHPDELWHCSFIGQSMYRKRHSFCPYRSVNTVHLCYKDHNVNAVYGNKNCFSLKCTSKTQWSCVQRMRIFWMLDLVLHKRTKRL